METSAIAAFWGVALLLVIAPGADWAYTLSAALRGNAVRSAVGGLITGYAPMTVVVGALVAGSGEVLTSISLIGGACPSSRPHGLHGPSPYRWASWESPSSSRAPCSTPSWAPSPARCSRRALPRPAR
jgi:hypothetical protein